MNRVHQVLADIVGEAGGWEASTALRDIDGWDSLNHVRLVIGLESEFGVSLSAEEIRAMVTIGDVERILREKGTDG